MRSNSSMRSRMSSSAAPGLYILSSSLRNKAFTSSGSQNPLPSRSCKWKNVLGLNSWLSIWSCFSHTSSSCCLLPGWCNGSCCLCLFSLSSISLSICCLCSSSKIFSFSCFSNSFCISYSLNSWRRLLSASAISAVVFKMSFRKSSISKVCGLERSTCSGGIFRCSVSIPWRSSYSLVARWRRRSNSVRLISSSLVRTRWFTFSSS